MIDPPKDTPEYAHGMWAAALLYATRQPEIVEVFNRDTGLSYTPPKSKLDQMIDESTGLDSELAHAFGKWFNDKIWGPWGGDNEA